MTHKDVRVAAGKKCEWKSGQRRDGRHQAELNPNFPVTFWTRSWLFLALCRARDRAGARVWPALYKSTTCYKALLEHARHESEARFDYWQVNHQRAKGHKRTTEEEA